METKNQKEESIESILLNILDLIDIVKDLTISLNERISLSNIRIDLLEKEIKKKWQH